MGQCLLHFSLNWKANNSTIRFFRKWPENSTNMASKFHIKQASKFFSTEYSATLHLWDLDKTVVTPSQLTILSVFNDASSTLNGRTNSSPLRPWHKEEVIYSVHLLLPENGCVFRCAAQRRLSRLSKEHFLPKFKSGSLWRQKADEAPVLCTTSPTWISNSFEQPWTDLYRDPVPGMIWDSRKMPITFHSSFSGSLGSKTIISIY